MGALRPLIAAALAAVPFFFLDNTSTANIDEESNGVPPNPVGLTIILWFGLYFWSIFDAWRDAVAVMGRLKTRVDHELEWNRQQAAKSRGRRHQNRLVDCRK